MSEQRDDRLATFKRVLAMTKRGHKWTDEAVAELIGMVDTERAAHAETRAELDAAEAALAEMRERVEWLKSKPCAHELARRFAEGEPMHQPPEPRPDADDRRYDPEMSGAGGGPPAPRAEAGVPECVERWRGVSERDRLRFVDGVRDYSHRHHANIAADCLEYLATTPVTTPALILADVGDDAKRLELYGEAFAMLDAEDQIQEGKVLRALSRATIAELGPVRELVRAAKRAQWECSAETVRAIKRALAAIDPRLKEGG